MATRIVEGGTRKYTIVEVGTRKYTEVVCLDEPGHGGACHEYRVRPTVATPGQEPPRVFAHISFQNGPVKENGVNGCTNEDLLRIVADRLDHFQMGPYPCQENLVALLHVQTAIIALNKRTMDREARGVEGTNQK